MSRAALTPSLTTTIALFTLFCTASGLYASNQVSQAKAEERISNLQYQMDDFKEVVKEVSGIKNQVIEIRTDQKNQQKMLERIVNYVEKKNIHD